MTRQTFSKWLASFIFMAFVASNSALAENIERKFDVAAGGALNLKTDAGSVKVLTHKAPTAIVEVKIKGRDANEFELVTELKGSTLEVVGEIDGRGWNRNLRVEFTVTVPQQFDVEIDTAGGSINVADLEGNLSAETSGGSIRIGSIRGAVELNTSGGSISTEEVYGPLNAHTSGGSIRATFAEQLTENAVLDTSGGSITAYLVSDVKIELNASTSGGRVKTDFEVDGRIKKQSIRGEINGGGPELRLRTSGGSVSVRVL